MLIVSSGPPPPLDTCGTACEGPTGLDSNDALDNILLLLLLLLEHEDDEEEDVEEQENDDDENDDDENDEEDLGGDPVRPERGAAPQAVEEDGAGCQSRCHAQPPAPAAPGRR